MHVAPSSTGTSDDGAPRVVRRIGWIALTVALLGAGYLIWARGEAIVVDLSNIASKVWCF